MHGHIVRLIRDRGFGFLVGKDDQVERFFHRSDCSGHNGAGFDQLTESQAVNFEPIAAPKGPRAENVRPAGE